MGERCGNGLIDGSGAGAVDHTIMEIVGTNMGLIRDSRLNSLALQTTNRGGVWFTARRGVLSLNRHSLLIEIEDD